VTDAALAAERAGARGARPAHADPAEAEEWSRRFEAFVRISVSAPAIEVDTSDGYSPGIAEIAAFVDERR
jgi:hypothetical protein